MIGRVSRAALVSHIFGHDGRDLFDYLRAAGDDAASGSQPRSKRQSIRKETNTLPAQLPKRSVLKRVADPLGIVGNEGWSGPVHPGSQASHLPHAFASMGVSHRSIRSARSAASALSNMCFRSSSCPRERAFSLDFWTNCSSLSGSDVVCFMRRLLVMVRSSYFEHALASRHEL